MKNLRALIGLSALILSSFSPIHADDRMETLEQNVTTLTRVLTRLNYSYVEEVNLDSLTEVAIRAMLKELDPHTSYLSPREVAQMQEGLGGSFEGIGISYQMDHDTLVVIHPTVGGPSEMAGIHPADQIVQVGDSSIAGQHYSTDDIKKRLRGPRGSKAHLGVLRPGEPEMLYFDVVRDKIPVLSVTSYYMLDEHVGYIAIDRFAQNTADEVQAAIEALSAEGMQDLVIDLQGNGGGYLNAAVEMSKIFLPTSSTVVYTEGRSEKRKEYTTPMFYHPFDGRLVVLIDETSASASEIFAGAIQDHDRGIIVGRRSFGKGLVQRPIELPNGGMVRLTVSHYYTPSGRCIQKPYFKGHQQDYQQDLNNRLKSGEMLSADSIHVTDTLRYFTDDGRVVYGGGGIVPDAFVALDTTLMSPAHRAVIRKGSIHRFMLRYFRENYAALSMRFPTFEDFDDASSGFYLDDALVQSVIDQARQDSVKHEELDSLLCDELFRLQCYAYLANNLYDGGIYRRVMNTSAQAIRESLAILNDPKRYERYLQPDTTKHTK